jgi:parallel beta-helix repeat protein
MRPGFLLDIDDASRYVDWECMKSLPGKIALLSTFAAAAIAAGGGVASADVTCNKVASPTGSDTAAGTAAAPYRTALKLVSSLAAGQTGCLRAGTYVESIDDYTPNLTLTSYPGERATLKGRLYISDQASGTTVSSLNLDGRNASAGSASPTITGSDVTFTDNDVTNYNTAICFMVGSPVVGQARNVVIADNNIHNCGKLPAANHDHGIYLEAADGTVIRNNWIHNNADRGIQLFPNADNSVITGNVIDSNGEGIIFSGEFVNSGVFQTSDGQGTYETSDNNLVEHNVITNALVRHNVESAYPDGMPAGTGNAVRNNCIAGAHGWYAEADGSGIQKPQEGFTATNNVIADPQYVGASSGNYSLQAGSPCASILAGANVTPPPPSDPPPSDPPPSDPPTAPPASPPTAPPASEPTPPPASAPTEPPAKGSGKKKRRKHGRVSRPQKRTHHKHAH